MLIGFSLDLSALPKLSCSTDRTCKCLGSQLWVFLLTLGRRVTVVVLSFIHSFYLSIYLSTALQRAALTSSRQLRYEQAKHVDGLQSDGWILLKCFRSRVMADSP